MENQYHSRGYLLDPFRLFHLNDRCGIQTDFHYHEFCKLILLRSGNGSYIIEGKRYQLQAGDILLLDKHMIHRPEFASGILYERIIIYISSEFFSKYISSDYCLQEAFLEKNGHILRLSEKRFQVFFSQALQLEKEFQSMQRGSDILSEALLVHLLVGLAREQHSETACCPAPLLPQNPRICEILQYIDAHLTEDITIDRLSEYFYISKYHMMHLFQKEIGQTIHDYMTERRLLHARKLIRSGKSATESCFASGFRSYSAFSRAWNKHFKGTTPTGRGVPPEEEY